MEGNDQAVTSATALRMGLPEALFHRITALLERPPSIEELHLFAHLLLPRPLDQEKERWRQYLPGPSPAPLIGALELDDKTLLLLQAGVRTDAGAFTSTAQILSRFFISGGIPQACLHTFRFGDPQLPAIRQTIHDQAAATADHANILGIPTLGGKVYFHPTYNATCLIDSLMLGVIPREAALPASPPAAGDRLLWLRMQAPPEQPHENTELLVRYRSAMAALHHARAAGWLRRVVPVEEKGLVLTGARTFLQSPGCGLAMDLPQTPADQPGEGFLLICPAAILEEVETAFADHDLLLIPVGSLTEDNRLRINRQEKTEIDLPRQCLDLDYAPAPGEIDARRPGYMDQLARFSVKHIETPGDLVATAHQVFTAPQLNAATWIFQQGDATLGGHAIANFPSSDAYLFRMRGREELLAVAMEGSARFVYADPFAGGMLIVARAARRLACSGAKPMAMACSLGFPTPDTPERQYLFQQTLKGIGEAARKFGLTTMHCHTHFIAADQWASPEEPIFPTPAISVAGVLSDPAMQTPSGFQQEQDLIYMIGTPMNDIGSSEYLIRVHDIQLSPTPLFDLDEAQHIQLNLLKLIRKNLIASAHGISEGGLFAALLECALPLELGFVAETDGNFRKDAYLFGESQNRVLLTVHPDREDELVNYLNANNVPFTRIGEVGGPSVRIDDTDFGSVRDWKQQHQDFLEKQLNDTTTL